ncbi:MAG: ribonuclease P protein component [Saprospiraceae bacterium]|nr:ribonuclease P protein component [Saprospiraceae bacterium]
MPDFSFTKAERLCSRKAIERLFSEGNSFAKYPLRLVWLPLDPDGEAKFPVETAMSVPRKKFKKAVHRNRIRRLMREAYRVNKHRLYRDLHVEKERYAFMLIYTAVEELSLVQIEEAVQNIIRRFLHHRHDSPKR